MPLKLQKRSRTSDRFDIVDFHLHKLSLLVKEIHHQTLSAILVKIAPTPMEIRNVLNHRPMAIFHPLSLKITRMAFMQGTNRLITTVAVRI
jgi:hypothetical protein